MAGHERPQATRRFKTLSVAALLSLATLWSFNPSTISSNPAVSQVILAKCAATKSRPGAPAGWTEKRKISNRFVPGTKDWVIQNAVIWTGTKDDDGKWIKIDNGTITMSQGIVTGVYDASTIRSNVLVDDELVFDARGRFVTPGLFDLHSHLGVYAMPSLQGASDGNSIQNPILPYLRSLDGFNTHDMGFRRTVAGGVTTVIVLPGSANNIGGQAFPFKLRPTAEKTPTSMLVEQPWTIPNSSTTDFEPWRYMKFACGENIMNVYGITRMDESWNFRRTFSKGLEIKNAQDEFCSRAEAGLLKGEENFPEELQWEAIVDILRGKVKVQNHCYETVDFDQMIRHSNEFGFPISAFHHAGQAHLVPDRLKQTYGGTPAIALFATHARRKREAYRNSEFAPKILAENGVPVVMKSDHPVLDSRHLLFEAAQAHHFGFEENLALASVTRTPADTAGMGHRLGRLAKGFDADVVVWDRHPLSLGATPVQVWIDGIAQIDAYYPTTETVTPPSAPTAGQFPETSLYGAEDIPELITVDDVVLFNISNIYKHDSNAQLRPLARDSVAAKSDDRFTVTIVNGSISSITTDPYLQIRDWGKKSMDLQGGVLLPPLTVYGPPLGLVEIGSEESTMDGTVYDELSASRKVSDLKELFGARIPVQAVDGLSFGTKQLAYAYNAGVTRALVAPQGRGFFRGLSVLYRTTAAHVLEPEAVIKRVAALHVSVGHHSAPSISTQIGAFRELLIGGKWKVESTSDDHVQHFRQAAAGKIPVVIDVEKADHMAALIRLKREVEEFTQKKMRWIFAGAKEGHLVAEYLAAEDIGVIITQARPYPLEWDGMRSLDGPPLSPTSLPVYLADHNVSIALGVTDEDQPIQLLWESVWQHRLSGGRVTTEEAIGWVAGGIERLLGLELPTFSVGERSEFIAISGDVLDFGSRVVAIGSVAKGIVVL
ncbi:hypothetical protein BT69DRAFT_904580 [Atractiella rhizophila]|nr:hypothetical protein BT69DRAFT_904580 [Atractiella rhizophila]